MIIEAAMPSMEAAFEALVIVVEQFGAGVFGGVHMNQGTFQVTFVLETLGWDHTLEEVRVIRAILEPKRWEEWDVERRAREQEEARFRERGVVLP